MRAIFLCCLLCCVRSEPNCEVLLDSVETGYELLFEKCYDLLGDGVLLDWINGDNANEEAETEVTEEKLNEVVSLKFVMMRGNILFPLCTVIAGSFELLPSWYMGYIQNCTLYKISLKYLDFHYWKGNSFRLEFSRDEKVLRSFPLKIGFDFIYRHNKGLDARSHSLLTNDEIGHATVSMPEEYRDLKLNGFYWADKDNQVEKVRGKKRKQSYELIRDLDIGIYGKDLNFGGNLLLLHGISIGVEFKRNQTSFIHALLPFKFRNAIMFKYCNVYKLNWLLNLRKINFRIYFVDSSGSEYLVALYTAARGSCDVYNTTIGIDCGENFLFLQSSTKIIIRLFFLHKPSTVETAAYMDSSYIRLDLREGCDETSYEPFTSTTSSPGRTPLTAAPGVSNPVEDMPEPQSKLVIIFLASFMPFFVSCALIIGFCLFVRRRNTIVVRDIKYRFDHQMLE